MNTDTLPENKKRVWTLVFLTVLFFFAAGCFRVMNLHYDTLARYPYQDRRSREKIRQYLTKEEIEYLIEYSIAPNVFISFIEEDGFNIYHAAEYKQLSEFAWDQPPGLIVRMVEETRDVMDTETLIRYLNHYTYDELQYYLNGTDVYASVSELVDNPANTDCYVGSGFTVSGRVPKDLCDAVMPHSGEVLVSERLLGPMEELCTEAEEMFPSGGGCGFLRAVNGYVSYDEQAEQYRNKPGTLLPGQDEHQLGYAVDLRVEGLPDELFIRSEQYAWLEENAWRFGFVRTRDDEPYHWRFIGEETVSALKESGMTFNEYGAARQNDIEH